MKPHQRKQEFERFDGVVGFNYATGCMYIMGPVSQL